MTGRSGLIHGPKRSQAGRSLTLLGALLGALALLTGCAKGPDKAPLQVELIQTVGQTIQRVRGKRAEKPKLAPLSRALLEAETQGPVIEVMIENSEIYAYLFQQLAKRDDFPGEVVGWRTLDNIILTTRDGVLVATRGLPNDLLGASALVRDGTRGPTCSGQRMYEVAALDNASVKFPLACQIEDLGAERIEIVELHFDTRHLREVCELTGAGPGDEFWQPGGDAGLTRVVNDYWVDSRTGRIWQSRQWAGPKTGYLRIRQLTI